MRWTLGELTAACGAILPASLPADREVRGVCTDTRALQPGEVFLALVGERFDGHEFAAAALQAGATAALLSRPVEGAEAALLVSDTLVAYGQIAHAWRRLMPARVAAITGSVGKSTCKGLLASICAQAGPTLAAAGTENNEIGVPKTLLQLEPEHRFCVLELGMRGRGEIRQLAEMGRPEIGVITTIGESHIGRLGSREAIAESKAEMLPLLPAAGVAVLPADDFFYPLLAGMCPCRVLAFGHRAEATVRCLQITGQTLTSSQVVADLAGERLEFSLPLPGRHNVANALAAAAAGLALDCSPEQIRSGLESYQGLQMRGEILAAPGGVTVLNDTYNANPTSMAAALQWLAQAPGRKIGVLGDMLELGDTAPAAHRQLGGQAVAAGVSLLVTIGEMAALATAPAAAAGVEVMALDTPEAAAEFLRPRLQPGDTVLVKASRGLQLERTVRRLLDEH